MIELTEICKTYKSRSVNTEVLKEVTLTIQQGEFVCLFGCSGSGKTTLLNIIGLIDTATNGKYYFNSDDVTNLTENQRAIMRNLNIGYIFQAFHLVAELSVLDNITLPMGYAGKSARERKARGAELLELVGMTHRAKYYPASLSGGEKQRVAIARALANKPSLILADEPTGNLDSANAKEIMSLLKKCNKEGCTVVLVTHDEHLAAECDRILHLVDGQII